MLGIGKHGSDVIMSGYVGLLQICTVRIYHLQSLKFLQRAFSIEIISIKKKKKKGWSLEVIKLHLPETTFPHAGSGWM